MLRLIYILIASSFCGSLVSQKVISNEIQSLKSRGIAFEETELVQFETVDIHRSGLDLEELKRGTIVSLDRNSIQHLLETNSSFIQVDIPINDRATINLVLKEQNIFTPDFKVFISSDHDNPFHYKPGKHYRGVIEGDPNSLVAISVFDNQIMGLIATANGNLVLGPIKDDISGNHIIYNDRDLEKVMDFTCGTEDDGIEYTKQQLSPVGSTRDENDCVRLHIEIDDNIVTGKGGATNAINYATAMFNQSFLLYVEEAINVVLSEIKAWTTDSPYVGSTQSEMLASYKFHTEHFNGDLSQLITYSAVGGAAAGRAGLCNPNPDLSKCFSRVDSSFNNLPDYSWTVYVITHEVGHLLGSAHTHLCLWNGNNTAIDACYPTSCPPSPPLPPDGGTIMSYCYLANSGSYINYAEGFGPQPGAVIRNSVNAANNCLSVCGDPMDYCTSSGTVPDNEYINNVVFGSISNVSGNNNGYGNYTSLSTTLNAGNSYTITATPKSTNGANKKYWRLWIDYNHDFDWYDTGELVGEKSGNGTVSITFSVPANAITTTTRMRLSMRYQAYPVFCGSYLYGEVEDYTVQVVGTAPPSCSDGIQNQGETGIDCGGPCDAICPPSCMDGMLNQGETLVDCGGPCLPCPTCDDGIQNQSETGIDCGGECNVVCQQPDSTVLLGSYFETGMDSWIDGGSDVTRVSSANSYEGSYSIRLADNSGTQSAMTSPVLNLADAVGAQIQFHFYAVSMETAEDFWVMYNNGSGTWSTIAILKSGTHFNNNAFYAVNLVVPNFTPTSSGSFRIQCDASDNSDQVFIDAVTITKLTGPELIEDNVQIKMISDHQSNPRSQIILYPNPAKDLLYIKSDQRFDHIRILNVNGQDVGIKVSEETTTGIDVSSLNAGIYFVFIGSGNQLITSRFVKQ